MQCEISGRSLLKKIKKLLGWTDNSPRMCFGVYLPSHQAVRFDLTKAKILEYNNVTL